jgi:F-type H+-transporting ATPase subunit gamma
MASLREIRRKIKSIKSTQQITKAMKMVAAARLRRAQARIINARPFAQRMEQLISDLLRQLADDFEHPLFGKRPAGARVLLLVTSDKGLCGAFNTNLIREAVRYVRKHGAEKVRLFIVGRKGRDYFRRLGLTIEKEYLSVFGNLSFAHAEIVTEDLVDAFLHGTVESVDLIYSEFKSVIQQRVIVKQLLPLAYVEESLVEAAPVSEFIYEPGKEALLKSLIPRSLKAQIFRVLLESSASELGARMAAMDNATRNAKDIIGSLTLQLNRTRQATITNEILEVVSGAEALR